MHLLQDLLRKELGFKGFVVSDAFAVGSLVTQGFARDGKRRGAARRNGWREYGHGQRHLSGAHEGAGRQGTMSAAQLDELVRPILAAKYHLGLFEHPYADATEQTHAEMLAEASAKLPEQLRRARRCCCAMKAVCCRSQRA